MKPRGYVVRIKPDQVVVEHRVSYRPATVLLIALAYLSLCGLHPDIRRTVLDFYKSPDLGTFCFALLMVLFPFALGAAWLFFISGEVMRCDALELTFAKRRFIGRWHRQRFSSANVRQLQRALRMRGRSTYSVLTFEYDGQTVDMLENISLTDSERVLRSCSAIGLNAPISVDPGAGMLRDIEQKGWFVNPLKPE